MDPKKFIEPKTVKIDDKQFVISKIPAVQAQQIYGSIMRECKDDGDLAMTYLSEETGMALLKYAAVDAADGAGADGWIAFESSSQVDSYCKSISTLIGLEAAMIRYNFGFLFDGSLQKVLGVLRDEGDI